MGFYNRKSRPDPIFALVVAVVLGGPALGQPAEQGAPAAEAAASPTFRDVIRLHEAGFSEDFVLRKIGREGFVYRLSTDDVIACKQAGLPESIVEAMLKTAPAPPEAPPAAVPAPAEEPVPVEAPKVADAPAVPAPPAAPAPSLAAQADRSWEGMVHRAPGVVLFRSPWEQGMLSFRGETLVWTDASDEARSFVLPAARIVEQFLLCPKDAGSDGECFEWGVKTADGEHRFRSVGWERNPGTKPRELFDFVQAIYPDLPAERYRAKKR